MELKCLVFESYGGHNTAPTLESARDRALALGIKQVVVASSHGATASKAQALFAPLGIKVIAVSICHSWESEGWNMTEEEKANLISQGVIVHTGIHALGDGVGSAFSEKYGGRSAEENDAEDLPLSKHAFLQGLDSIEIEQLASRMERREFSPRQLVVRRGDPADALLLLVRGRLSVLTDDARGSLRRLATISPGMGFGEPAILDDAATRTAFVRADRASVCWVLARSAVLSLDASNPMLKIRLLENLLRSTARIVERLRRETVIDRI